MSTDVSTCHGNQNIEEAAEIMVKGHVRRLAVVDYDERIQGFLSVDDLAHASHQLASNVLESSLSYH